MARQLLQDLPGAAWIAGSSGLRNIGTAKLAHRDIIVPPSEIASRNNPLGQEWWALLGLNQ
jgi:hypothetical protein